MMMKTSGLEEETGMIYSRLGSEERDSEKRGVLEIGTVVS
jgi:hypothetical protein